MSKLEMAVEGLFSSLAESLSLIFEKSRKPTFVVLNNDGDNLKSKRDKNDNEGSNLGEILVLEDSAKPSPLGTLSFFSSSFLPLFFRFSSAKINYFFF